MARPSKIDRLPPEIREAIGALRRDGHTIDEILAHLRQLGVEDVSRSGVGRHVQGLDRIAERIQHSRAAAEAMIDRFGDQPEQKVGRLNIELAHSLILQLMAGQDGEPVVLDAEGAMQLATAIQRLTSAAKTDLERETKLRAEIARLAAGKVDEAAAEAARAGERGLSAERLAQLRRDILGVRTAP